jgi:hypothetical protein
MCLSTREHSELKVGCVYYADDVLGSWYQQQPAAVR